MSDSTHPKSSERTLTVPRVEKILMSDRFLKQLNALSHPEQERVRSKIELLAENPSHPSLKAHQLKVRGYWECYISDGDRMIYATQDGALVLYEVGRHEIIERFYPPAANAQLHVYKDLKHQTPATDVIETAAEKRATPKAQARPSAEANPFAHLPPSHLRILGVPAALVSTVQNLESIEQLEQLEGLKPHIQERLLDLLTNDELSRRVFVQNMLFYRATLDRLHQYIEGSIKRLMLDLTPEQDRYVQLKVQRPTLLRGCAGSGKTTIAIYRAIALAERGERVLFLTYTKTLAKAARDLIEESIGPLPDNLEVKHVDFWLAAFLETRGKQLTIFADDEQRRSALRRAIDTSRQDRRVEATLRSIERRLPAQSSSMLTFLRDEFLNVIKGHGIIEETEYLRVRRYGRGIGLQESERRAIWQVYQAYRQACGAYADWQDLAMEAFAELRLRALQPAYDHVVVDEVQDLSPIQLRVILELVKGSRVESSLFFVGDIAQTIYSRGFAWKELGLEMRGSSFSLRRNFRNTRQIAEAAALLNANNVILRQSEDFVEPEPIDRQGARPIIIECDVTSREPRAVRERILSLIEGEQFRPSDMAIIAPTKKLCEQYEQELKRAHIACAVHTQENFSVLEEHVKILTIHSAKGLEFPVVFVVGLHEDELPRKVYALSEEEQALHLEQQRTLLYVAMTRASEGLFLVSSQERPSRFLSEIVSAVYVERFTGVE